MKKSIKMMTVTSLLVLMAACNANNNAADRGRDGANVTGINRYNNNDNVILNGNRTNQKMDVADDIADSIAQMKEVDRATVILTNNNAYVSVKLNGTNNMNNRNRASTSGLDRNRNDSNQTSITDQTPPRTNNINNGADIFNGNTINDNNNDGNNISANLERKITKRVKAHDRSINNVYISADTNFFNDMTNYSNTLRNGNMDGNFFNDFNNNMRKVFPNNR